MSAQAHLEFGRRMGWPGADLPPPGDEVEELVRRIAAHPGKLWEKREAELAFWKAEARRLEPLRRQIQKRLPSRLQATVGKLHLPLIAELARASGHPDADFLNDLVAGFALTGELAAGGVGRGLPRPRMAGGKAAPPDQISLAELRKRCDEINEKTLRRGAPEKGVAEEVWKKSLTEQAEGRLGPFKELWEVPLDQILLVPRFGV